LCDPCGRSVRAAPDPIVLPDGFYARPAVVEALAGYDFGAFFRAVRSELRLTQDEFGWLAGLAQSRVCMVENGALHLRDVGAVARLASALGVPADLLGFKPDLVKDPAANDEQVVDWMQRRDFIATATALALGGMVGTTEGFGVDTLPAAGSGESMKRVGMSDVARIETTTAAFLDWYRRWGGGPCRSAITAQLDWVMSIGRSATMATEAVRRRLLAATAELARVATWAAYDMEQHSAARRFGMISIDAGREAGNSDLACQVLRPLTDQALHLGRPDEALRLVRLSYAMTADSDDTASNRSVASIASYEAWCHAAVGSAERCERALAKAEEHFGESLAEDERPWLVGFDETELLALRGHAYHVLAEWVPEAAPRAVPLLEDAAQERGAAYPSTRTLYTIALASTQLCHPDTVADGIRNGYRALDGASTLNSPRALSRLRGLDRMAAGRAKEPEVAEFRSQLHRVLVNAG
jgi:transcriptional regulator with XRE-family HTH domain